MIRPLIAYTLFAIALLSNSCEIVGALPQDISWGYLTADMNGNDWSKTYDNAYQVTQGRYDSKCSTEFQIVRSVLFTSEGYHRQEIVFSKVPRKIGRYLLESDPYHDTNNCDRNKPVRVALYTSISDGDVLGDIFKLSERADNYIQIDKYDAETEQTWGKFQVLFVRQNSISHTPLPDTLRFTGGKFHTKIVNYNLR